MPSIETGYDRDDELAQGDTMDEGLYLNIMFLMAEYDISNQDKLVYKLNIFGSLIGITFDTVSTYAQEVRYHLSINPNNICA